jgi:hypothetical protein
MEHEALFAGIHLLLAAVISHSPQQNATSDSNADPAQETTTLETTLLHT